MTLNEKAGITDQDYLSDPVRAWDAWIDALGGLKAVMPFLPYTIPELCVLYQQDRYFNAPRNAGAKWDAAAGYSAPKSSRPVYRSNGKFKDFLVGHGVTTFANSECVCLLKRCAERLVIETMRAAIPDELYAVMECKTSIPDRFNQNNIYNYGCTAVFLDKKQAESFEMQFPERRVLKIIDLKDMKAGLSGNIRPKEADPDET